MWSVFFVFLSYLDRNFVKSETLSRHLDAEKESKEMFFMLNSTFCAKMSAMGENYLYQVSDGAEEVRSVVSPAGKLVDCSVIVNQMQVKSFMHVCRLGLKEQRAERLLETPFARMDEAKMFCREFNKRPERTKRMVPALKQLGKDEDESPVKRSKRGFTYPGTLWCGAGNMADSYDHLGEFAETDSCCRIHDHCPHVIHAFSSKYGHTNFKWHSICHCDCDNALKACLRKVNDTASRVVGQAFFNVIGVPCFEFTYEEQCAERHWYGLCKRYEKFPVAVLKDSVPYDFGGIDVIDVLTLAPPKKRVSMNSNEERKPENTSQSTISGSQSGGPEEPSIRNMVTAAEDFIKVLATVSTSQSSTADPAKGETQSSERKKGKSTGKKKQSTKKHKGKRKGRKRKLKAETGAKAEEGASVPPSGSKAEEVVDASNFISEAGENEQPSRNTNRFIDSQYDLVGKEEHSNEVLKDEPAMDKETSDVSVTSVTPVKKQPVAQDTSALTLYTEITPLSTSAGTTTVIPHKTKSRRSRKGRRKKSKTIPIHPPTDMVSNIALTDESLVKTIDTLSNISVPTTISMTPTAQLERKKFQSPAERHASPPIVIPKVKRNRSKERAEGEERKKRRKIGSAAPIVAAAHKNSSADNLTASTEAAAPTTPPVPAAGPLQPQVSHRSEIYGRTSVHNTAINSTFSVLTTKRQRSKERGQRNRKGKTAWPLPSKNPPFRDTSENVAAVLPASESISAPNSPTPTSVISVDTKSPSDRGFLTTVTRDPSVSRKPHRLTVSRERKPRKQTAHSSGVTISGSSDTLHTPAMLTRLNVPTVPSKTDKPEEPNLQRASYMTTTARALMSPVQLSIQRAREQFSQKKRRKSALSLRQQ